MRDKNIINVAGQVVDDPNLVEIEDKVTGKKLKFIEFKLKTTRLSGECDIVPVTIQQSQNETIEKGDSVNVSGELRGVGKEIDGKRHLKIYICGLNFMKSKSLALNDNFLILEGYVTRPVCHRYTPFGREIADILLANNDGKGNSYYIPCIVWGSNANFAKDLKVGSKIKLVGRLQSREYTKIIDNGKKSLTTYEVSARSVTLLRDPTVKTTKDQK